MERRDVLGLDVPAAQLPSSFELDWNDVDVSEEPSDTGQEAAPSDAASRVAPHAPAAPSAGPSRAHVFGDLGSDQPAPGPALSAPPLTLAEEDATAHVLAAEVVPLEDLDFGESPFAAPPRPAVQPAPEPEPVELPMLEAEEEIELTPVGELTPGTAETGSQPAPPSPPAMSEPPLASEPAPTTVAEWMVAHGLSEIAPPRETREPDVVPARPPSDGGEAQLREALSGASREVIERIAWEVVPQLAETIIREQVDRLVLDRVVKERLAKERLG